MNGIEPRFADFAGVGEEEAPEQHRCDTRTGQEQPEEHVPADIRGIEELNAEHRGDRRDGNSARDQRRYIRAPPAQRSSPTCSPAKAGAQSRPR